MYLIVTSIILFLVLCLTVFVLYKLLQMPGKHKLKYIQDKDNEKLEEPVIIKSLFFLVAFIAFISITGYLFLHK